MTPRARAATSIGPAIAIAIAAGVAAPAQEPARPRPSSYEERVVVGIVQVPILAVDRRGRPVRDLRPEEIVVKDGGERRQVAYLEPLRAAETLPGDVPALRLYVAAPGGWDAPVEAARTRPHHLVILVDVENDDPLRRNEGLDELMAFARTSFDGAARVAVASYDGTLRLETPFTSERGAIESGLARAWSRERTGRMDLRSRVSRLVSRFEDCRISRGEFSRPVGDERCLRDAATQYVEEVRPASNRFLDALEQLVRILAGLEGRKTVLALSHGVAMDPAPEVLEAMKAVYGPSDQLGYVQGLIGFGDRPRVRLDQVLELAVRRRVSFFFVDRTRAPAADAGARAAHAFEPGARPFETAFAAAQDDLREASATTGGVFVASPEGLEGGLSEALAAQDGAYEVGYRVSETPTPGRLAKVVVSSTRKGARISHRRGYYAQPPGSEPALKGSIEVRPASGGEEGRPRVAFRILVDPKALGYRVAGADATADFTLHVAVRNAEGRPLAESFHFIHHAYPRDLWEAGKVAPVVLPGWLEAPRGAYEIVATLRNVETDQGGRLVNAVEFP